MLIDLHAHPIFDIDDGARDLGESITMAKMWEQESVQVVYATHHFDIMKDDLNSFYKKTRQNQQILAKELAKNEIDLEIKFGAELLYRQELANFDLSKLVLEDTDYLLIEFPTRVKPIGIVDTFQTLINQGYNLILAHVERYQFLKKDLDLFHELLDMGVVMQMNASHIINGLDRFDKLALERNYIHVIASDAHRFDTRKPNLSDGLEKLPTEIIEIVKRNTEAIKNNEMIDTQRIKNIKNIIGIYV